MYKSKSGQINGKYSRLGLAIQHFMDEIITGCSQSEASYSKMLEKLLDYDAQIKYAEEVIAQSLKRIAEFEEKRLKHKRYSMSMMKSSRLSSLSATPSKMKS